MSHVRRASRASARSRSPLFVGRAVRRAIAYRSGVGRRGRCRGRLVDDPAAARRRLRARRLPRLRDPRRRRSPSPSRHRPEATWSTSEALAAVAAVQFGGAGPTPLDALDDYAPTIPTGALARHRGEEHRARREPARARPDRLRPCRRRHPVDLVSLMGGCSATTARRSTTLLYIVLAQSLRVRRRPSAPRCQAVRDAQQANGGWTSTATRPTTDIDIDTTALAVQALVAGGADADRSGGARRARLLRHQPADQTARGSLRRRRPELHVARRSSASPRPGTTSTSSCWRDTADPGARRHRRTRARPHGCARSSSPRRRPTGPHREPQRQLRREHVRHVADGRGARCSRGSRSRAAADADRARRRPRRRDDAGERRCRSSVTPRFTG